MRKGIQSIAVFFLAASMASSAAVPVFAAPPERYLHVRVLDSKQGESVNVNVPLSLAEKILPTINKGELHNGHVTVGKMDMDGVDVRGILDAIRTTPDNEFVSVKQKDQDVRVAKSNGNLIVHVINHDKDNEKVDVTVPLKVVDALFSTAKDNELDIAAALRTLSDAGDALLVTVQDATQHVRIWVDSKGDSAE
jgi:hypothetical protein